MHQRLWLYIMQWIKDGLIKLNQKPVFPLHDQNKLDDNNHLQIRFVVGYQIDSKLIVMKLFIYSQLWSEYTMIGVYKWNDWTDDKYACHTAHVV